MTAQRSETQVILETLLGNHRRRVEDEQASGTSGEDLRYFVDSSLRSFHGACTRLVLKTDTELMEKPCKHCKGPTRLELHCQDGMFAKWHAV